MKLGNQAASIKYWTAESASETCVLDPCSLHMTAGKTRETEIAAAIIQIYKRLFYFHEQIYPNPRLVFNANVSHVIRKIWDNFQGKVGSKFTCNSRLPALIENAAFSFGVPARKMAKTV